jgi:acetyl-CoA C-acetyltransferase
MAVEPVIVAAARTPIARENGALRDLAPEIFGAAALRAALERAPVEPEAIDDVILGNVMAGGGNIARLTALEAGCPVEVPGLTIDRQCGSGIQAIALAADLVRGGQARIIVAGGTESMTRAPYLLARAEQAYSRQAPRFVTPRLAPAATGDPPMGLTAEQVARQFGIGREEQDRFALTSQQRAAAALADGRFRAQLVPLEVPAGRGETRRFDQDEHPRPTTLEGLARLRPAFAPDGSVTAGNASGINDGAAAVVVMASSAVVERGLRPLAVVRGWAVAGVEPSIMGMGPVPATRRLLARCGVRLAQIDLIELNEAFASQALACIRALDLDPERVNISGGAIALGHPIAATGAILIVKLLADLQRTGGQLGLVTACIGGGQGIAALIELL